MEYYSVIKMNAFESVLMRQIKQSEVKSERKTPIQYTSVYIWNLQRW